MNKTHRLTPGVGTAILGVMEPHCMKQGANVIKLFSAVIYNFLNKLDHLSLASLSSLV